MLKAGMSYINSKEIEDRFGNLVDAQIYEIQNT
jgi:hypothetical protein